MNWKNDDLFYTNEEGNTVLTAAYLLQRGYCCGNGCKHCPYEYKNVAEPKKTNLLNARKEAQKNT